MPISTTTKCALWIALAVLLAPAIAQAQEEVAEDEATEDEATEDEATEDEATEDEATEDEAAEEQPVDEEPVPEEPVAEEEPAAEDDLGMDDYVPGMEQDTVSYDDQLPPEEDEEIDDGKPFGKGSMEPGILLGGSGNGEIFFLAIGGSFAYYVINGLAPGIQLTYEKVFSDNWDYPQSFSTLPFLKWVFYRSLRFSPYVKIIGGREFQWDGSNNPEKGVRAVDAWIFGGGAGAHIGIAGPLHLYFQLMALYYWYDEPKVFGIKDSWFDDEVDGSKAALVTDDLKPCDEGDAGCNSYYLKSNDTKDIDGDLFFPIINVGIALVF